MLCRLHLVPPPLLLPSAPTRLLPTMSPMSPQRMLWPLQHANTLPGLCQLLGLLLLALQLRIPSNNPLQLSMLPTPSVPLVFNLSVLPFLLLLWFLVAWTSCLSLACLHMDFTLARGLVCPNTIAATPQSISRSSLARPLPLFHLTTRSVTSPRLVFLIPSNTRPRLRNTTPPSA
jgi:hypothetical protein